MPDPVFDSRVGAVSGLQERQLHRPSSRWQAVDLDMLLATSEHAPSILTCGAAWTPRSRVEHERVTVTRNGRPVAVLISPEDLGALEETLAVLSDPHALADIREADAAYAAGDVIRGADAIRALRP